MRKLALLLLTLTALSACTDAFSPLETDQESAGVRIEVTACEADATSGVVTATYELTSEQEYTSILLNGEVTDESGVVVATTAGSLSGVQAGRTYRDDLVFGSLEAEGEITCNVTFEHATSPIG